MKLFQDETLSDSIRQQEALLNLGPLYEPEPVAFTFDPIGWKILAVLIVALILIIFFLWLRRYRHNKYRRTALAHLSKIDDPQLLPEIFVLLKSTAIQTFGREKVGSLFGESWLHFLDQTAKSSKFKTFSQIIFKSIYSEKHPPISEFQKIKSQASNWISNHAHKL